MAKNILVIDDDGMVTKSLCRLLEKSGFSTETSENGVDAIELIKNTHIDMIIADIRLPGINGVETVKKIKEIIKGKHKHDVPVIFITGYSDAQINAEAQTMGDLILKPFDNQKILEKINSYI
ncbi:MAG: response regulator [Candidatus Omnitrophica bacterium]|nr:response regulator [Candidatus Omnitrophota bacterium]MCM8795629.1 response regulator [Candidatus Omnitrophota bacterium]